MAICGWGSCLPLVPPSMGMGRPPLPDGYPPPSVVVGGRGWSQHLLSVLALNVLVIWIFWGRVDWSTSRCRSWLLGGTKIRRVKRVRAASRPEEEGQEEAAYQGEEQH